MLPGSLALHVILATLLWRSKQEASLQNWVNAGSTLLYFPASRTVSWANLCFLKLPGLCCFAGTTEIWLKYQPIQTFLFVFSKGDVLWGHQREIQSLRPVNLGLQEAWFCLFGLVCFEGTEDRTLCMLSPRRYSICSYNQGPLLCNLDKSLCFWLPGILF